jgi:hypothetical protein
MEFCKRCFRNIADSYEGAEITEDFNNLNLCYSCLQQRNYKRAEIFNDFYTMNTEGDSTKNLATALLVIAYLFEEKS